MDIEKCRYIVVEGPIGAGKTSLARQLAVRLSGDVVLERPEDNPFLARFYEDMARYALPTQLTFLFQRLDQLTGVGQLDMFRRSTRTRCSRGSTCRTPSSRCTRRCTRT